MHDTLKTNCKSNVEKKEKKTKKPHKKRFTGVRTHINENR